MKKRSFYLPRTTPLGRADEPCTAWSEGNDQRAEPVPALAEASSEPEPRAEPSEGGAALRRHRDAADWYAPAADFLAAAALTGCRRDDDVDELYQLARQVAEGLESESSRPVKTSSALKPFRFIVDEVGRIFIQEAKGQRRRQEVSRRTLAAFIRRAKGSDESHGRT